MICDNYFTHFLKRHKTQNQPTKQNQMSVVDLKDSSVVLVL